MPTTGTSIPLAPKARRSITPLLSVLPLQLISLSPARRTRVWRDDATVARPTRRRLRYDAGGRPFGPPGFREATMRSIDTLFHTPLCDLLGIRYPVLQAGMGMI